jgi:hypothetical protein
MNLLIDRLLAHSGFRWDPSAWTPMVEFFKAQSLDDQAEFVEVGKAMPLSRYEKTVYWGIISGHMVSRDKRCRNCANPHGLQVHHSTYEHQGWEHMHLGDLVTLCFLCHASRHQHMTLRLAREQIKKCGSGETLNEVVRNLNRDTEYRRLNARENRNRRSPWD